MWNEALGEAPKAAREGACAPRTGALGQHALPSRAWGSTRGSRVRFGGSPKCFGLGVKHERPWRAAKADTRAACAPRNQALGQAR